MSSEYFVSDILQTELAGLNEQSLWPLGKPEPGANQGFFPTAPLPCCSRMNEMDPIPSLPDGWPTSSPGAQLFPCLPPRPVLQRVCHPAIPAIPPPWPGQTTASSTSPSPRSSSAAGRSTDTPSMPSSRPCCLPLPSWSSGWPAGRQGREARAGATMPPSPARLSGRSGAAVASARGAPGCAGRAGGWARMSWFLGRSSGSGTVRVCLFSFVLLPGCDDCLRFLVRLFPLGNAAWLG